MSTYFLSDEALAEEMEMIDDDVRSGAARPGQAEEKVLTMLQAFMSVLNDANERKRVNIPEYLQHTGELLDVINARYVLLKSRYTS